VTVKSNSNFRHFTSVSQNQRQRRTQKLAGVNGIDFVCCRICGDRRRVISGRHLSKHDTDRETYIEEYGLSPDELIAKDFRKIQSSRRGFYPYGKHEWIAAIKNINKHGGSVFAGDLQDNHPHLYNQGVWIFGDWDSALRAAGFEPERMRIRRFWDKERVVKEIRALRRRKLPLTPSQVIKNHTDLFSGALRQYGSWNKALVAAGIADKEIPKKTRLGLLRELRDAMESRSDISNEQFVAGYGATQAVPGHYLLSPRTSAQ
jgi:hypothetical protein